MGVALVPDSPNHCLVRREPGWPNTDAGGGGGGGVSWLLCGNAGLVVSSGGAPTPDSTSNYVHHIYI